MHIGIPLEIKNHEYRVGAVHDGVQGLVDPHLAAGLQTCNGRITHSELARDLGMNCVTPAQALA